MVYARLRFISHGNGRSEVGIPGGLGLPEVVSVLGSLQLLVSLSLGSD